MREKKFLIYGVILALFLSSFIGFIPVNAEDNNENFEDMVSTTGPIPPEGLDPGLKSSFSEVVISNVPAYIWRHGCGPTAAGMVIGYYDTHGYCNLVSGFASSQTNAVNQMIASGGDSGSPWPCGTYGHYEDYSWPEDSSPTLLVDDYISGVRCPARAAHGSNCLADFMDTSKSTKGLYYGWSSLSDVGPAMTSYVNTFTSYGITTATYSFSSFSWDNYKAEIDANRPVVFLVDTDGDDHTDHFVTGIGYDDATGKYGCRNTWDSGEHWYDYTGMSSGNPWGIYGIVTCQLTGGDFTPPTTTKSIGWPNYGQYVTTWTPITLTASDSGGCGVKEIHYMINGVETIVQGFQTILYFDEECTHVLEFWAVDNAGNEEDHQIQIHYVDDTPPTTYREHFGHGYYYDPNSRAEYIKCGYEITLEAVDGGLCQSGVIEMWYNTGSGWFVVPGDTVTFTMPNEECEHTLEYFAVDNLINIEPIKTVDYYIDCTPPVITKTHPDPCYFPIDATTGIIKVGGRIVLETEDVGTYPCISGVENTFWRYDYEGTSHPLPGEPGAINGASFGPAYGYTDPDILDYWWYYDDEYVEITFNEICKHTLHYWAKDNVCNRGPLHTQTYYVNDCQDEVHIDDDFVTTTPGWWHTHFRTKQMALDWLGPYGTAYMYDGIYDEEIIIDDIPCCDNTGITQKGEYGCFPITESAVIKGSETIKVNDVTIKYLEYTPNTNGAIIIEPNVFGTNLRCNKFRKDCVANAIGVIAKGGSDVNARLNWWGAPDGPQGGLMDDGKIADGNGVKVIGNVMVEPWIGIHAEIADPVDTIEVEQGTPVTFDATGSFAYTYGECCQEPEELPLQYLWDFDDGMYSADKKITHVFDQLGTHHVRLQVDSPGIPGLYSNFMYDWAYVTVHVVIEGTPLTADADGGNLGGYHGFVDEPIQLYGDAYGGSDEYNWFWDFGDNTMDSTEQNPTHVYTQPGTYIATLTVISDGETATDTTEVIIHDLDELFVIINDANTQTGVEAMFSASINGGTPPYITSWDFGDGTTSDETNPTHIYTNPGEYTVTVFVTDDNGKTAEDTAIITVDGTTPKEIAEIINVEAGFGIKSTIYSGDDLCNWEINVEGKHVFSGGSKTGMIEPNKEITVDIGFSLAFGRVTITVTAEQEEKTFSAFALGPFYLNLKEI